ncbi:hypothetical protein D3C85_1712880 [compost metagenome]
MPTTGHEHHDHMIARLKVADSFAQRFDHASSLMAERHGHRPRAVAIDHRKVGMTKTCGTDTHQHFARPRRRQLDGLNNNWLALGIRRLNIHVS